MMSIDDDTLGDEIIIPQKIYIENDIELDRDNTILVQTFVYANEEDEDPSEAVSYTHLTLPTNKAV